MIRRASIDDMPLILEMGRAFHRYSPYGDLAFDEPGVTAVVAKVLETGAIFVSERGMIGGVLLPLWFSPARRTAVEMFWWAEDGQGQALRGAFEGWAAENGALVQLSVLTNEHADRLDAHLVRHGYRRGETSYVKGL